MLAARPSRQNGHAAWPGTSSGGLSGDEYSDDDDAGFVAMAVVRPGEFIISELQASNDDTDSTWSGYGYHRHVPLAFYFLGPFHARIITAARHCCAWIENTMCGRLRRTFQELSAMYWQARIQSSMLAVMCLSRYRPRKPEEAAWGGSVSHSAYDSTTPGGNCTLSRTSSQDCGISSHISGSGTQHFEVLQA